MKMDVDMGLIIFTNGTTGTFSNEEFHVDTEMYTSMANMDKIYFIEHGTTHVHTPVALADKAATCTENGYTDRTFCEACNSVVEWGTTIVATGHDFVISVDKLACDCGRDSTATGLQTIGGKNYYAVNGKLQSGWINIDEQWYFFNKNNFEGANGQQYADNGIKFAFENGRLLSGSWDKSAYGTRYWYGPGFYKDTSPDPDSARPYEIDGKTYLFSRNGWVRAGIVHFFSAGTIIYYDCAEEDGAATLYTGPYGNYFYIDGLKETGYKLVEHEGYYYYISDGHKLAKNVTLYLNKVLAGTGLAAGKYTFDADGKMLLKNGPVGDYFYKDNVMLKAYQIVEYEGSYYYVSDGHKLAKNVTLYLSKVLEGTGLAAGKYTFDADGKMIIKNGPVGDYFYRNGVKLLAYQIVEYEGDYYYVSDGHRIVKNQTLFLNKVLEGTGLPAGSYTFDADGKMILN
jgi:hypothetical protein